MRTLVVAAALSVVVSTGAMAEPLSKKSWGEYVTGSHISAALAHTWRGHGIDHHSIGNVRFGGTKIWGQNTWCANEFFDTGEDGRGLLGLFSARDAFSHVILSGVDCYNPKPSDAAARAGQPKKSMAGAATPPPGVATSPRTSPPAVLPRAENKVMHPPLEEEMSDVQPIPLPAALWSLIAALAGLGVIGRRRRAATS